MRATDGGNSKINFIPVRDDRGQNLQWFSVFGTSLPIRLLKFMAKETQIAPSSSLMNC